MSMISKCTDTTQRHMTTDNCSSMSVYDASIDELNDLLSVQHHEVNRQIEIQKMQYQRTPGQILSLTRNFDFSMNCSPTENARKCQNPDADCLTLQTFYTNCDDLNASTSILQQPVQQPHYMMLSTTSDISKTNAMVISEQSNNDPSHYFKTWSFRIKNEANNTNKKRLVKRNSSANLRQRLYGCSDDTPLKWSKHKSHDCSSSKNFKRLFASASNETGKRTGLTSDFDLFKIQPKSSKVGQPSQPRQTHACTRTENSI
jgi:hypothetical protein